MAEDCSDRPATYRSVRTETLARAYRPLVRHEGLVTTPKGEIEFRRDVYEIGAVAAVVPYDPVRDLLVLQRQFRLAIHLVGLPAFNVEIAAGLIDEGETPEEAAKRECEEELGVPVADLKFALRFLPSTGWLKEEAWLYAGRIDSSKLPASAGHAAEAEYTEPFTVAPDVALKALDEGRIVNGFTIIGLQWFARNRERLRAAWS